MGHMDVQTRKNGSPQWEATVFVGPLAADCENVCMVLPNSTFPRCVKNFCCNVLLLGFTVVQNIVQHNRVLELNEEGQLCHQQFLSGSYAFLTSIHDNQNAFLL